MNQALTRRANRHSQKSTVAGILIGIGMGGFIDGIVLHQLLQWHNMVSNLFPPNTMENMRVNMVWDGAFHAFVWIVTLSGIFMLWSVAYRGEATPSLQSFVGQLILGWGLFNLVEGIIDHQILALHYVRQAPNYTVYNLMFLAIGGVLLIIIGWLLLRAGRQASGESLAENPV